MPHCSREHLFKHCSNVRFFQCPLYDPISCKPIIHVTHMYNSSRNSSPNSIPCMHCSRIIPFVSSPLAQGPIYANGLFAAAAPYPVCLRKTHLFGVHAAFAAPKLLYCVSHLCLHFGVAGSHLHAAKAVAGSICGEISTQKKCHL